MIIPAIIPQSFADLKQRLKTVAFSRWVQIDVVDGKFVEHVSWPYVPHGDVYESVELLRSHDAQIDLMVYDSVAAGRTWLLAGAKALVFHLESLEDPQTAVALQDEFDFELGFSISNHTPLETLYSWIDDIDFVQLMGIATIGSQGQPFDARVLERIATLRHLYPGLTISIDGGVNQGTIRELMKAGADRFVTGSAIIGSDDPARAYHELLKISDPA